MTTRDSSSSPAQETYQRCSIRASSASITPPQHRPAAQRASCLSRRQVMLMTPQMYRCTTTATTRTSATDNRARMRSLAARGALLPKVGAWRTRQQDPLHLYMHHHGTRRTKNESAILSSWAAASRTLPKGRVTCCRHVLTPCFEL